jgi:hypothetical protein
VKLDCEQPQRHWTNDEVEDEVHDYWLGGDRIRVKITYRQIVRY